MKNKQANFKCGGDCSRWRRCNYCRFSGTIENKTNNYPAFCCRNEDFPMCCAGDGFECIFRDIPENCICIKKEAEDFIS